MTSADGNDPQTGRTRTSNCGISAPLQISVKGAALYHLIDLHPTLALIARSPKTSDFAAPPVKFPGTMVVGLGWLTILD